MGFSKKNRVNISNAEIFGLREDLDLGDGTKYNTALTIFFVPYVIFEVRCQFVYTFIRRDLVLKSAHMIDSFECPSEEIATSRVVYVSSFTLTFTYYLRDGFIALPSLTMAPWLSQYPSACSFSDSLPCVRDWYRITLDFLRLDSFWVFSKLECFQDVSI